MLLNSSLPSRLRTKDNAYLRVKTGPLFWRNAVNGWVASTPSGEEVCVDKGFIYDERVPRFAIKPCYAEKESHTYTTTTLGPDPVLGTRTDDGVLCGHPGQDRFTGTLAVIQHLQGPLPADKVLAMPEVQDALSALLTNYYRHMYTISNDLPDMTVFLKELGDFARAWEQIMSFAGGIASLVRKYVTKGRDKWITLPGKAGNILVQIFDSRRPISGYTGKLDIASEFVGWNFGIAAPLRDCCAILTEILAKLEALVPDNQRRKEHFTRVLSMRETTPINLGGDCSGHICPAFSLNGVTRQSVRDIEVRLSITSTMIRELTGSRIEKAIAAVLGVLGLLPNHESIWEMTRLSWMLDYIFRTDKLFRAMGLYQLSPVRPILLDECCSVSIKQKIETTGLSCSYKLGEAKLCSTYEYFERALGTNPLEFKLGYACTPSLKEMALAVAVAKQWFF